MKLRTILYYFFASIVLIPACSTIEETGDLEIVIKLTYQGEPLVMFDKHEYPSGEDFFVDRVSLFLSDIKLDDDQISEVLFKNLTPDHQTLDAAQQGSVISFSDLLVSSFQELSFDIGVPVELNAMKPLDFERGHPLFQLNDYWDGWNSYVFFKIEGKFDKDQDGSVTEGIALHVGADETLRSVSLVIPIDIKVDQTTTVTLELDLYEYFTQGGSTYDLAAVSQIHNLSQLPVANELADRLQQTIKKQ